MKHLFLFATLFLTKTFIGQEEIHNAAKAGDLKKVQEIIAANPSALELKDKDGLTPLHYASTSSLEVVSFLVSKGADVNVKSKNGNTPLYSAARFGKTEIAQFLLEHKADINIVSAAGTVMHQAVYRAPVEFVSLLLKYKPDLTLTDSKGQTALHIAAIWNAEEAFSLLMKAGADINAKDKAGDTPLHACLSFADKSSVGSTKVAKLLIDNKASLNEKNNDGLTPLALAKKKEAAEMIKILTAAGAKE
jgi:ankyrin repeat protein